MRTCTLFGCNNKYLATGVCRKHYERLRNRQSLGLVKPVLFADVVEANTEIMSDGCIVWTGNVNDSGYGMYTSVLHKELVAWRVHRLQWVRSGRKLKRSQLLDHICHNRACFNLDHLRIATPALNNQNRKASNKNSKTGVRGVCWSKHRRAWLAQVGHNYKNYVVGAFATIEEAEAAVKAKRLELFEFTQEA